MDDELIGEIDFDPAALKRRYDCERDRRVRTEGKAQYVGTMTGRFAAFSADPWARPVERAAVHDHTRVIVAGGGFGGLLMGARLREAGVEDVRIIEVGSDFGGTWYWNRYPGAMCDLEAHIYLPLLEELGYTPKHRYSYAPEMLELSQRIGKDYSLYDKALFQTSITGASWSADDRRWTLTTDQGDEVSADFFIAACGRQSLPKLPGLAGTDQFSGHMFHTSRWDYAYTGGDSEGGMTKLAGKRIGFVGTGATALQAVPKLAEDAGQLFVFQRTPSTVGQRDQCKTGADWADMSTPGWQRERRDNFQKQVRGPRPPDDQVGDGWTAIFAELGGEPADELEQRLGRILTADEVAYIAEINDYRVMNGLRTRVADLIDDPDTAAALQPWYRWWCKRPGFHDDYLPAFNRPNVTLVDTEGQGVEGFTATGVVAGGVEYPVDCVIFGTGFEASVPYTHLTGFDIVGRHRPISEHWSGGVRTLYGLSTDSFPNLFFIGGNLQTANAVNAVHLLDEQAIYVAYVIAEVGRRAASTIEPGTAEVDAYVHDVQTHPNNLANLAFYQGCTPGYYNNEGRAGKNDDLFNGGRYGDGPMAYYELLRAKQAEHSLDGYLLDGAPVAPAETL